MLKYIFPILIFILHADKNITNDDLVKFDDKFYLANSYKPYTGKVMDYYNNGIKKMEGYYNQGAKDGTWLEFYDSGKLKSEIIYSNNKASHTSFDTTGAIIGFGMLINDIKDGLWIEFDKQGNEKKHFYYSNGLLDSLIDIYIPIEIIQDTLKVLEKISIDITENELFDKQLEIKNGEYITYFDSGKYLVEFYKDNLLEGLSTLYHENGKKYIERTYYLGQINKKTYEYDELGLLKSVYQEKHKNNILLKDGEYISYHINESINEIGFLKNGYRFGKWFVFDENGKKRMDIIYDLKSVDIDSTFIKTNVTSYYSTSEKMNEYLAHSYLNCNDEELCDIYNGAQHNKIIKHGDYFSLYNDGALKEKGQYYNDIKNGLWNEYYPSGKILSNIDYIDGNGLYNSYYDKKNTIKFQIGYYIDEKKNGLWSEYDLNGELIRRYYYSNGKLNVNYPMEFFYNTSDLDQYQLSYDVDNPLIKMRFYCTGFPEKYTLNGIYEEYYVNNNLKTKGIYKDGVKFSYWNEYYNDNSLRSKVLFDEEGNGEYESYLDTGEISSTGFYKSYRKDGKWLTYYPNGNVEWILFYFNDKINPNKLCSNWYETGYKKIEGFLVEYKNKIIWDGKYTEYYDNGIISLQGNYTFGEKNGNWIEYYPNRIVKNEGAFLENKEFGKWYYYNEEGDLIKTNTYE